MGSWRRQRGEIRQQEMKGSRSWDRKPPLGNGCSSVPAWEKKFCISVGSVPWRKLIDTKKCMYLYENVLKWDDSAGKEAFHNAKSRFWAKINNLPCEISLPDPDIYIDEIDWNSSIDPDLLLDLEREPSAPVIGDDHESVSNLSNSLGLNQSFWCTGWGEAEEDLHRATDKKENPWENSCSPKNRANEDKEWDNGWNMRNCGSNSWNKGRDWYNPRWRVHGDEHKMEGEWRIRGGRKWVNFSHASACWEFNSWVPVSHHGSGKGGPWGSDKPVW